MGCNQYLVQTEPHVAIPLNRVKVSIRTKNRFQNRIRKCRNPLKSGQGFNVASAAEDVMNGSIVVIPLNRVKVSTASVDANDIGERPGRNPLKSGQGFNFRNFK